MLPSSDLCFNVVIYDMLRTLLLHVLFILEPPRLADPRNIPAVALHQRIST